MNQFGQQLRLSIFGESHGAGVGITIDGIPAGLPLKAADFLDDMLRRQGGLSAGTTPRKEADEPQFISGLFEDHCTGAPLTLFFPNENTRSSDYSSQRHIPRPGHADYVASRTFNGYEDYRGGGHFSGRLTTCLVAAGVIAKKLLHTYQIFVTARLKEAGGKENIDAAIEEAVKSQNSIGGIVECTATGLPVGLGHPFFGSLESQLAALCFSIPAIKGVEFGSGFQAARMWGSDHNDALINAGGTTRTNHSGGINGGISNGNPLVLKVAVKPASSTPAQQVSFSRLSGKEETFKIQGRHDLCIALRVPPVLEACVAICLADAMMQRRLMAPVYSPVQSQGMIYHICDPEGAEQLLQTGTYTPSGYATEGFIHCCLPHQLEGVVQRHFGKASRPLIRLTLVTHLLDHPLRYEYSPSLQQYFPHLYGPVNAGAVWSVDKLYES